MLTYWTCLWVVIPKEPSERMSMVRDLESRIDKRDKSSQLKRNLEPNCFILKLLHIAMHQNLLSIKLNKLGRIINVCMCSREKLGSFSIGIQLTCHFFCKAFWNFYPLWIMFFSCGSDFALFSIKYFNEVSFQGVWLIFFSFCGTGTWVQDLHLEPFHQPFFLKGFFKMGSLEPFARVGFKLRSSWSLPPE
jgi:hypothetical protein